MVIGWQIVSRDLREEHGARLDDEVDRSGKKRVGTGKPAGGNDHASRSECCALCRRDDDAVAGLGYGRHFAADNPGAGLFRTDRLRQNERMWIDVAGPLRLVDAGKALGETEPGKAFGQCIFVQKRRLDAERVASLGDLLDIVVASARRRAGDQAADFRIEIDAALPGDLSVTVDGTLGETRPDGIVVDRAGDSGIVVMAGKDAAVIGPVAGLVRPDQGHPCAGKRQVPCCGRPHHALADNDEIKAFRHVRPHHLDQAEIACQCSYDTAGASHFEDRRNARPVRLEHLPPLKDGQRMMLGIR